MLLFSRRARIAVVGFGLVVGMTAPAHAHRLDSIGFYHFPGDHSLQHGYMDPEEWEERCVTITSEIDHGPYGKGRSWMKWTTSQDIGHYFYDCSYAYRAFQAQWWKTNVFVTVVLRKVGVNN